MNTLLKLVIDFFTRKPNSFENEFLAASSDVYDLEYRMRELERRNRQTLMLLYR